MKVKQSMIESEESTIQSESVKSMIESEKSTIEHEKIKCIYFRGRSRMEEWQLGPPLLVGDRVVHLGEVDICRDSRGDNYDDDYDVPLFSDVGPCCSFQRGSVALKIIMMIMIMIVIAMAPLLVVLFISDR